MNACVHKLHKHADKLQMSKIYNIYDLPVLYVVLENTAKLTKLGDFIFW